MNNFYTVCAKILKNVDKSMKLRDECFNECNTIDKNREDYRDCILKDECKKAEETMDLALKMLAVFKDKANSIKGGGDRCYMITIRPNENTLWETFYNDTESYISANLHRWKWVSYAYEQKGTNDDELGKGFHVHIILKTDTINYYPMHILRNTQKYFKQYVAPNCVQVDSIKNFDRACEYISGDKRLPNGEPDKEKLKAVAMDNKWRQKVGISEAQGSSPSLAITFE